MKPFLTILFSLILGSLIGVWILREPVWSRVESLAAENERLRLFNAREARRYKKHGITLREKSCSLAEHILGTPRSVTGGMWIHEDGPPDIETGILGKTDYFSKHFPIEDWAALEAARTINIYAWKYLQSQKGDKAWKEILQDASKAYTGNTNPEAWANNIYKIEKTLRQPR